MTKEQKLERILTVSLSVFAKYGYKKTTVEDIAGELGMTKGNLYLYARDKRDLYEKTVSFGLRRWQQQVIGSVASVQDTVEHLRAISLASFLYLAQDTDMRELVIKDPSIFPIYPDEDRFYDINLESINVLKEIIERGINEGVFTPVDAYKIAQLLFSIYIMFVHKAYVKVEGQNAQELFETGLELFIRGLQR
ncbi:MAG: TetR/AcrR family transcriptional regulator [Candidatus Saccharibacteria bacterium]